MTRAILVDYGVEQAKLLPSDWGQVQSMCNMVAPGELFNPEWNQMCIPQPHIMLHLYTYFSLL